jgi:peptidoglycan hydrolase CwlO-like protein
MTTVDNTQLAALVSDFESKEQALSDASDSDSAAQKALADATAAAAATLAAKSAAHDALVSSGNALVSFVHTVAS